MRFYALALAGIVTLAGCNTTRTNISAPPGHPANPHSRQAAPIAVTRALDNYEGRPVHPAAYEEKKTPVPEQDEGHDPHAGHQMHKH